MRKGIRKHFHWVIAAVVFLEMIVFGGIINSVNVYVIPITESLGVTRGAYSLAGLPYSLVSFLSAMVCDSLFSRIGQRRLTVGSLLISAAALVMRAFAKDLTVYTFSMVLFGIGFGACFTAGAVRIIKLWFHRHQGLVLGAVSMASGLGGSLMTAVLTKIIVISNWRHALLFSAGLLVLTAIVYLTVRDRPQQMGLKPYGEGTLSSERNNKRLEDNWPGFPGKVIRRRPLFYLMCLTTLLSCTCVYLTSFVVVPYFQDLGYSAEKAASFDSVLMLVLAFAKLGAGWLSDRIGGKSVAVICMIFAAAGQWMLAGVTQPIAGYVAVSLFAVGLCMASIVIPLVAQPLFGYRGSTEVNSVFISMASLAVMIATPTSNLIYDSLGTYRYTFLGAAILDIFVIGLYFLMFAMARREKKRYEMQTTIK